MDGVLFLPRDRRLIESSQLQLHSLVHAIEGVFAIANLLLDLKRLVLRHERPSRSALCLHRLDRMGQRQRQPLPADEAQVERTPHGLQPLEDRPRDPVRLLHFGEVVPPDPLYLQRIFLGEVCHPFLDRQLLWRELANRLLRRDYARLLHRGQPLQVLRQPGGQRSRVGRIGTRRVVGLLRRIQLEQLAALRLDRVDLRPLGFQHGRAECGGLRLLLPALFLELIQLLLHPLGNAVQHFRGFQHPLLLRFDAPLAALFFPLSLCLLLRGAIHLGTLRLGRKQLPIFLGPLRQFLFHRIDLRLLVGRIGGLRARGDLSTQPQRLFQIGNAVANRRLRGAESRRQLLIGRHRLHRKLLLECVDVLQQRPFNVVHLPAFDARFLRQQTAIDKLLGNLRVRHPLCAPLTNLGDRAIEILQLRQLLELAAVLAGLDADFIFSQLLEVSVPTHRVHGLAARDVRVAQLQLRPHGINAAFPVWHAGLDKLAVHRPGHAPQLSPVGGVDHGRRNFPGRPKLVPCVNQVRPKLIEVVRQRRAGLRQKCRQPNDTLFHVRAPDIHRCAQ